MPIEQENDLGGFSKLAEAFAELVESVTSLTGRKHKIKFGQVGKDSGMKLLCVCVCVRWGGGASDIEH